MRSARRASSSIETHHTARCLGKASAAELAGAQRCFAVSMVEPQMVHATGRVRRDTEFVTRSFRPDPTQIDSSSAQQHLSGTRPGTPVEQGLGRQFTKEIA